MFCELHHVGNLIYFFRSFADGPIEYISGRGAERIGAYPVSELVRLNTLPNLRWLIPMALDDAAKAIIDYDAL